MARSSKPQDSDQGSAGLDRRSFLKTGAAASGTVTLAGCALFGGNQEDTGDGGGDGGSGGGGNNNQVTGNQQQTDIPDEPLQLGATSFMSGPATILGKSITNTVRMLVDRVNSQGGILGEREIELTLIDEIANGGPERFRQFATEGTDVVIGYASTGNALRVAPLVEDLEMLTIFQDTGSMQLFEETISEPHYAFRTGATLSVDGVGAAQLVANRLTDVETVAGIHPDYGYGQNTSRLFQDALAQLAPDVEVVSTRFPPLLSVTDYSPHIDALSSADPDFIFSSLWGGDAVTFMEQGQGQGLFEDRLGCFMATHIFGEHSNIVPEGALFWPRGPHFPFMNVTNPVNEAYVQAYIDEFGGPPWGHTAFHWWNAFEMYIRAVEKAHSMVGGWPNDEQIIAALEGMSSYSTAGHTPAMTRKGGHQGIEPAYFGHAVPPSQSDNQYGPGLTDEIWISPEHVNPPAGMSHSEWINSLDPVR